MWWFKTWRGVAALLVGELYLASCTISAPVTKPGDYPFHVTASPGALALTHTSPGPMD